MTKLYNSIVTVLPALHLHSPHYELQSQSKHYVYLDCLAITVGFKNRSPLVILNGVCVCLYIPMYFIYILLERVR